jgi:hypothetical protein
MNTDEQFKEWLTAGFKGLVVCIFSMFTFFVSQLNTSIGSLTAQLRAMEDHQIQTDKRVAAIEVSREINMEAYKKVVGDVQEMKVQMVQNTMRLQTVAEFVSKHIK